MGRRTVALSSAGQVHWHRAEKWRIALAQLASKGGHMRVRLLREITYNVPWAPNKYGPYAAGTVVPVIPAYNQPKGEGHIRYWLDTPEIKDDPYGIGLYDGDFEEVEDGDGTV